MPRPEKVQAVAEIKEQFEGAQAVFLTEYRGIAVKQMGELRRRLREAGAEYKVVKMTLAKLAADDLGIEGLSEEMVGPTALAFANDDPVRAAKALSDYAKENDSLIIKLGLLADRVLRPEEVIRLAEIEPREVLLAMIAGAAKAPLVGLASMLSSFTRDAANVFTALLEQKEASEVPSAEAAPVVESAESAESTESAESADSEDSADSAGSADTPDATEDAEAEASDETDEEAAAPTETDEQAEDSPEESAAEAEEE